MRLLDAAPPPAVAPDPTGRFLILVHRDALPPISALAEPLLEIGGRRINPRTHGPHAPLRYVSLTLVRVADGMSQPVRLPAEATLGFVRWSPDGSRFAFTVTTSKGIELWVGDPHEASVRRLTGPILNATGGAPCAWTYDSRHMICRFVSAAPALGAPSGSASTRPIIMQSAGEAGAVSASWSVRRDASAQPALEHFMTAQLAVVDASSGEHRPIGVPAVFDFVQPAPGAPYLLVSRRLPGGAPGAEVIEIWDDRGRVVRALAHLPPSSGTGASSGPRGFRWQASAPAVVVWVEGAEKAGGKGPGGDALKVLPAPFSTRPRVLYRTEFRFAGLEWLQGGGSALVHEYHPLRGRKRSWLVSIDGGDARARLLWDRDVDARRQDPGEAVTTRNRFGERVIAVHQGFIYLAGRGAGADGERSYLDRMKLDTLETERLWRSPQGSYETLVQLLSDDAATILTRHETPASPPNYFVRDLADGSQRRLTRFERMPPDLVQAKSVRLVYEREDGVALSATLHVPAGYRGDRRLPMIIWAYPKTYRSETAASQRSHSLHRFVDVEQALRLMFLLRGYAVMDDVAMPVIGEGYAANDTFVGQIVANAAAAIDAAVERGIADRDRVGVAGHSYGAFMVVNLLAHSDLFRAGVALSGAYNRTLTPFGFQTEKRHLWDAPATYLEMSPLLYADRISAPLLLIHGLEDDNAGTSPMQSRYLYQAIEGTGGDARLVLLPREGHVYRARESVLHTAAEMLDWFDAHVKGQGPRGERAVVAEQGDAREEMTLLPVSAPGGAAARASE